MTIETTIHRRSGGFPMIESMHQTTVANRDDLAFTNKARTSMEDLHASEETIRQCISHPETVFPAFAREPGEKVVQITKLDLHVVYNESMRLVVDVTENWNYAPNDPKVIERGDHPDDRGILRDLYMGLRIRRRCDSDGAAASEQGPARPMVPAFRYWSRTVGRTTWLGRQE
jgi:hypothetical protein